MICSGCDYKKNATESICNVQKGSDGLPVAKKRDRYIISWVEVGD
jgi:hypothetical protein